MIGHWVVRVSSTALLPLKDMKFVLSGKMNKEKYQVGLLPSSTSSFLSLFLNWFAKLSVTQGKIEALGGKVENKVESDTVALVSDTGRRK